MWGPPETTESFEMGLSWGLLSKYAFAQVLQGRNVYFCEIPLPTNSMQDSGCQVTFPEFFAQPARELRWGKGVQFIYVQGPVCAEAEHEAPFPRTCLKVSPE